jgi:hypothetical protein
MDESDFQPTTSTVVIPAGRLQPGSILRIVCEGAWKVQDGQIQEFDSVTFWTVVKEAETEKPQASQVDEFRGAQT